VPVYEPAVIAPAIVRYRPLGRTKWEYKVRTPYGTHEYEYKYDWRTGMVRMEYDFDD